MTQPPMDDDFQDRIQRILNEKKKDELREQYGAHFGEGEEKLPPEVESEWLDNIAEFERQFENAKQITVRERIGNPQIRLPRSFRPGEVVEVRARLDHASYTGLALKGGKFVRELPEFYVTQMVVYVDDQKVSEFEMTSGVSPNPLIRFPLKVGGGGTLRVVFVNSEGRRWEATQPLRPA